MNNLNYPSTTARLANYRLREEEACFKNLHVAPYQRLDITPNHPQLVDHIVRLKPQTIHDLKNWIGVPEGAKPLSRAEVTFVPSFFKAPRDASKEIVELHEAAYNFIFGHIPSIETKVGNQLNQLIAASSLFISVFLADDILVSEGSQLVLSVDALLARHITVMDTGTIIIPPSRHVKIDCAGFGSAVRFGSQSAISVNN